MYDGLECWRCHKNGNGDPLERHHVFGGRNRQLSEKYGAVVYLCGNECHRLGREAVHRNATVRRILQAETQLRLMKENDWDIEDFILVFGRNYI